MEFWDKKGNPVAYVGDDNEVIYLWSGKPVAWISDEAIYAFDGEFLGWFVDGWVRDRDGECVFFTDEASGGPVKPVRRVRPVKGVRGVRPVKGVREVRPVRAVSKLGWSSVSGKKFFGA